MPSYDASRFDPPAPVAEVTLRYRESGATVQNVTLLVDSGADVTLLPQSTIDRLGVPLLAGETYELMGFDGSRSFASAVTLDMVFLGRSFHGRYLLTKEDYGVLGRDVLNHVAVLLNGPQRQWSEHM